MSDAGFLEGLSERAPWGIVCRKTFDLEYKHLWKGLFHSLNVRESEVHVALGNGFFFFWGRDAFVCCTTHLLILEIKVLFLANKLSIAPQHCTSGLQYMMTSNAYGLGLATSYRVYQFGVLTSAWQ